MSVIQREINSNEKTCYYYHSYVNIEIKSERTQLFIRNIAALLVNVAKAFIPLLDKLAYK